VRFEKLCRKDRMDFAAIESSQPLVHALFGYLARRQQMY